MRILTVRQPWAWAIIHQGKDVENRSRNIAGDYHGPVAIHVGLQDDDDWDENIAAAFIDLCPYRYEWEHNVFQCVWCTTIEPQTWQHHGHIIGVVDLVDVHMAAPDDLGRIRCQPASRAIGGWPLACSPWAEEENYHLVLANPRPLSEPIPYRGGQGLRRLEDTDVLRRLAEVL